MTAAKQSLGRISYNARQGRPRRGGVGPWSTEEFVCESARHPADSLLPVRCRVWWCRGELERAVERPLPAVPSIAKPRSCAVTTISPAGYHSRPAAILSSFNAGYSVLRCLAGAGLTYQLAASRSAHLAAGAGQTRWISRPLPPDGWRHRPAHRHYGCSPVAIDPGVNNYRPRPEPNKPQRLTVLESQGRSRCC